MRCIMTLESSRIIQDAGNFLYYSVFLHASLFEFHWILNSDVTKREAE